MRTRPIKASLAALLACTFFVAGGGYAATKVTIHLDWLLNGYHAPFVVAVEKGWYAEAGLEVTVRPGKGTFDSIQAVGAGNAEFGFPDAAGAAKSISEGVPIKMVAVVLQETPMGIASFGESGIKEPKDLEGKQMGTVPIASTAKVLPAFCDRNGVDLDKINLVEQTFATAVPAFLAGEVDASPGYVFGEYLAFKNAAGGRELNWMSFVDYGIQMYSNGIAVNTDFLESNADAVRAFVKTSMRSLAWTIENPDAAIDILAAQTTTKREVLKEQLMVAIPLINNADAKRDGLGSMTAEKWKHTQDIMVKHGGQEKAASDGRVWTSEFLN